MIEELKFAGVPHSTRLQQTTKVWYLCSEDHFEYMSCWRDNIHTVKGRNGKLSQSEGRARCLTMKRLVRVVYLTKRLRRSSSLDTKDKLSTILKGVATLTIWFFRRVTTPVIGISQIFVIGFIPTRHSLILTGSYGKVGTPKSMQRISFISTKEL